MSVKTDFVNIEYPRLLGPIRLVEYKDDKRHIYFMGDAHIIKPVCWPEADYKTIEVQDFIQEIVDNTTDTIDLYVETPSIENDVFEENNWIDKIVKKFLPYFKVQKESKTNLRGHYVDMRRETKVRQLKAMSDIVSAFYYAISTEFTIMHPVISPTLWDNLKKALTEVGKDPDKLEMRKDIFFIYLQKFLKRFELSKKDFINIVNNPEEILTQIKFFKQVDNIVDKRERNFVLKFFDKKLSSKKVQHKAELKKFVDMLFGPYVKSDENSYCGVSYSDIKLACQSITLRNMEFMDAYTISRILRSYSDSKMAEKIIVYAGNEHISNYLDFFSKLEGEDKLVNVSTSDIDDMHFQCINISTFKLPFFS